MYDAMFMNDVYHMSVNSVGNDNVFWEKNKRGKKHKE